MRILFLVAILCATQLVKAQRPEYNDLRILFADGNYEKLVKNAQAYTEKESSKNDALPYFWWGKGMFAISQTNTKNEVFKNAYKEAISYYGNCIKRDVSGEIQREYVTDFEAFKMSLVDTISKSIIAANYKVASQWVTKYYKLNPKSIGAKYLEGVCKYRSADKAGAEICWKDADKNLAALQDFYTLGHAEVELLKSGIIQTVDCFVADKQLERAKTLLKKVKPWFEDENDFMAKYKQLVK